MRTVGRELNRYLIPCTCLMLLTARTEAQVLETVGTRALGMGGAFVAVSNDSSATWWNPAGLAAGPFVDLTLARAVTETGGHLPARRDAALGFSIAIPAFGFSYYRLRITDIRPFDPTGGTPPNREDRRAGALSRSIAASQIGITLVHTLIPGLHAGATLKYVRGTVRAGREDGLLPASELLDRGDDLEGGEGESTFDADVGLMGVAGPLRAGMLMKNVREADFTSAVGQATLPRQVRVGAAFDAKDAGGSAPTIAVDADLRSIDTATGKRRNVAVGAEHWFMNDRLGVRAGARVNTVGEQERSATGGVSVAVRAGLFVEGQVVRGGAADERGWGLAARVSF